MQPEPAYTGNLILSLSGNTIKDEHSFDTLDWLRLIAAVGWLIVFVVWPQITFAVTLILIGSAFIAFNGLIFWLTVVRKEAASSITPVFGGIIAAAGIAILPVNEIWKFSWIPLVIDWGGIPFFLTGWFSRRVKS
ncbi:MAG TPA: hypothetical protein VKB27_04230 [Gammaproteobacteria bacterium]|nr:hypothetical protein [Gammaproteobacteria bacterium]